MAVAAAVWGQLADQAAAWVEITQQATVLLEQYQHKHQVVAVDLEIVEVLPDHLGQRPTTDQVVGEALGLPEQTGL